MGTRGRYRTATPAIPSIYLYDKAGCSGFDDEFHIWDTIEFKTQHFSYTVDEDRVTIHRGAGYYEIVFQCSYDNKERQQTESVNDKIYLNGVVLDGAECWCTQGMVWSAAAQGWSYMWGNNNIHIITFLKPGDYIQVYGDTSYEANIKADSCRLHIKFLPMQGWDNSSSGRSEYKGGVLR